MKRGLSLSLCLLIAALSCGLCSSASGQVAEHSHRLKKLYDFEDTDDRGNKIGFAGKLMPRNWFVIGRPVVGVDDEFRAIPLHQRLEALPGFPNFSEVAFDRKEKANGDFSLRLSCDGWRTGAYVQHGAIHVKPESDYRVTARVMTRELDHAWAELHAYFVDTFGRRIEPSLRMTEPISTHGQWQEVSVKLTGDFRNVAYIGIELHIRQPKRDQDNPIGAHQIVPQDITGGAWFDDVAVWELPSVSISTGVATNIVTGEEPPTIHARVRDLTGQRLRAKVAVYNHRYERIDQIEEEIDKDGWSWTPDLKGRYGWYWADLQIYEADRENRPTTLVARSLAGLLWMRSTGGGGMEDRPRFVLVAEDTPTDHLPLIEKLMKQTGMAALVVSGWERGGTPKSTGQRARVLEPIARDLLTKRGYVAVSFWPVPAELAGRVGIDSTDPLNLLTRDSEAWMDYAKPFLSPLGQRLNRWQVGSSTAPSTFLARNLQADLEAARRGIRVVAPSPSLVAPWRLDQPSRVGELALSDTYAVAWPQGVTHGRLAEALEGWPAPPHNVRLDIELADAADMSHERRVADLMLRVLHAWEQKVGAIGLDKPWTEAHERHTSLTPDPVFGVWVNLMRQLEGQRVVGRMPLGPGLQAMILDGRQGGMLALWNERADEEPAEIALYLGDNPIAVDPFGNTEPLATVQGKQLLTVGQTPTIIRGIDPRLALLRAGFSLDEPFIESQQIAHRRTLRIHNPWPRTLNGYYVIAAPGYWTVHPQRKHLSIAPGDTAEVPIVLRFPIHENGGHKTLSAQFVFNVGQDYNVRLHAPMEIGLKGVDFDASVIAEPGKTPGSIDAIVELRVTNTGMQRQSLNIFAGLQGHARREMIIPGIAPGEPAFRRIRFKDVGDAIGKHPVRCGVRQTNGPAVLNQTLELLPPREDRDGPLPIAEVTAE